MLSVKIEKQLFDKNISVWITPEERSVRFEYDVEHIAECYNGESFTKKLSHSEYKPLKEEIGNLNLQKVFDENLGIAGCDGWTLVFALQDGAKITAELWNPEKDAEKPETGKLLSLCEKIFALVGKDFWEGIEGCEEKKL